MKLWLNILLSLVVPLAGPLLGALNGVWVGSYLTLHVTGSVDRIWDLLPIVVFALGGLILGGWLAMQIQGLDDLIVDKDTDDAVEAPSQPANYDESLPDAPVCPYDCACQETGRCGPHELCKVLKVLDVNTLKLTSAQPKACQHRVSLAGHELCCCPGRYDLYLNTGR